MKVRKKRGLTTTQIILFGFLGTIVVGTILLTLPVSAADGQWTQLIDALFTSTTSVCVTGLVTVATWSHWTLFGQIVIVLLIQVGGLGIVTFTTIVLMVMGRKISLKERMLIQDAYNLDTLRGLVRLTLRIVKGTLVVEGVGALLYTTVFIPDFGVAKGIWYSLFNAVSAFCNAGMDVIGDTSLMPYQGNVIVNFTTMGLIILGGIGFPVWWNVVDVMKSRKEKYMGIRDAAHHFTLHTKIAITVTAALILIGALCIFTMEYTNPKTLGELPLWKKIIASFFQSVTTRTAGFFTIPQEGLRNSSALICILLMFVGGSPSGTAGGIKTTTLGIILAAVITIVRGRHDTEAYGRKVATVLVKKAMAIIFLSLSFLLMSIIALCIVEDANFLDIFYECTSAIGTVGLSRALTGTLTSGGKLIIIITMYAGRVGPISLALFFNSKKFQDVKHYPEENVSVG